MFRVSETDNESFPSPKIITIKEHTTNTVCLDRIYQQNDGKGRGEGVMRLVVCDSKATVAKQIGLRQSHGIKG